MIKSYKCYVCGEIIKGNFLSRHFELFHQKQLNCCKGSTVEPDQGKSYNPYYKKHKKEFCTAKEV